MFVVVSSGSCECGCCSGSSSYGRGGGGGCGRGHCSSDSTSISYDSTSIAYEGYCVQSNILGFDMYPCVILVNPNEVISHGSDLTNASPLSLLSLSLSLCLSFSVSLSLSLCLSFSVFLSVSLVSSSCLDTHGRWGPQQ